MLKSLIISFLLIFARYFDAGSPSPTFNEPPEVIEQIEPQQVLVNEPFMFIVPVNDIFNDNSVLTYKASETSQGILPLWLKFDEDEHTFYGQPLFEEVDIYNISLIATDSAGLSTYTYFLIEVIRSETTTSYDFFEDESSTVKEALISVFTILGSISSYIIIEAVSYARWRINKNIKIEEDEDENTAKLNLSCDNYRNDCCNGKFKCLSCYSFCDQCCQNFFSSACDACCKDCCKEVSCICCLLTPHPVNPSQLEASSKNQQINKLVSTVENMSVFKDGEVYNLRKTVEKHRDEIQSKDQQIENLKTELKRKDEQLDEQKKEIKFHLGYYGVNLNAKDCFGNTPLHHAAYENEIQLVKLLLREGADKNIKNNKNETPLDLAKKRPLKEMIDLLERL